MGAVALPLGGLACLEQGKSLLPGESLSLLHYYYYYSLADEMLCLFCLYVTPLVFLHSLLKCSCFLGGCSSYGLLLSHILPLLISWCSSFLYIYIYTIYILYYTYILRFRVSTHRFIKRMPIIDRYIWIGISKASLSLESGCGSPSIGGWENEFLIGMSGNCP